MQMYNILSMGKANMFVTPCFFLSVGEFFFLMGGGVFFLGCILVWKVDCHYSLSIWTMDNCLSMQIGGGRGILKAKSSQVLDMFLKKIPIPHHFYPISFDKCRPLFIYIDGLKGRNSMSQNKTFYFGEAS
jgi:hypothetical protein